MIIPEHDPFQICSCENCGVVLGQFLHGAPTTLLSVNGQWVCVKCSSESKQYCYLCGRTERIKNGLCSRCEAREE